MSKRKLMGGTNQTKYGQIQRQLEGHRSGSQPNVVPGRPLTKREREIMVETALGLSNRQMAIKLFISHQTIKNHKTNIYVKLGVHGGAPEAIALMMLTDEEFRAEVEQRFEEREDER